MITRIEIDGFKTFQNFEMEFTPVTVIAGTNASGKSNLFDALSLLSRIAETDLRTAFSEQRGTAEELFTQYDEHTFATTMRFKVEVLVNKEISDKWGRSETLKYTRLSYALVLQRELKEDGLEDLIVVSEELRKLDHKNDEWLSVIPRKLVETWRPKVSAGKRGTAYIETEADAIILRQDGGGGAKKEYPTAVRITQSVLSSINSVDFRHAFALKEELASWKFLQLNPEALRQPTQQDIGMSSAITQSGENLAAALWRIQQSDKLALKNISRKLNRLLPSLMEVAVYNDKANKQFIIKVKSEDGREFSSRVLSEGTLRLLALCIFQYDEEHSGLLCFEEPENGVHPARMRQMAQLLVDLSVDFADGETSLRQVVINTHSPILVSELFELGENKMISVWLSQLVTQFIPTKDGKTKINVSRLLPVDAITDKHHQRTMQFEEAGKLGLYQLEQYLNTGADIEKTIQKLSTSHEQ